MRQTEHIGEHKKVFEIKTCVHHAVEADSDFVEFRKRHDQCPSASISNCHFKKWFDDLYRRRQEERAAVRHIVDLDDDGSDHFLSDTSSSEEEGEVQEVRAVFMSGKQESEHVSEHASEHVEEPLNTSTPKKGGIREQTRALDRDELKAKASQQAHYMLLKDRYEAVNRQNKEMVQDIAKLEIKVGTVKVLQEEVLQLQKREETLMKERREWKEKEMAYEEVVSELNHQRQEVDRLGVIERNCQGMREENHDLKRRLSQAEDINKEMKRRHVEVHLPIYRNQVCDVPTVTDDLNTTQECYEGGGVTCIHISMEVDGRLCDFSVRKVKRKIPSKLLERHCLSINSNTIFLSYRDLRAKVERSRRTPQTAFMRLVNVPNSLYEATHNEAGKCFHFLTVPSPLNSEDGLKIDERDERMVTHTPNVYRNQISIFISLQSLFTV